MPPIDKPINMINLTEEQLAIVAANPAHYVITAVAGSGKTTTLAYRIRHLLEQGVDARRMLILMFNRSARQDFSVKLQQVLSNHQVSPEVRTFHAMGYRLYQRFIRDGYLPPFQNNILSEKEIHFHIWRMMRQTLSDEALRDAKRNKKEHVELCHQFFETVKSGLHPPELVFEILELPNKFKYVLSLYDQFEAWRKQQSRISYTDMLYDPVMAIRAVPALAELVGNKMDVLLVDEYQDTNDIQHELMKLIAGDRAKITIVGDPDQTIYEFRGAKPEYLIRGFSKEFPDAQNLTLSYSFRYGHKVSLLANHLITNNKNRQNLLCKSFSANPATDVTEHVCENDAASITALLSASTLSELNQTAILARAWSQTVGIELSLLERKIPYHIEGKNSVFNLVEAQSIRAIIELVAGAFSGMSPEERQLKFELIFHFPHVGLPDTQLKMLAATLASYPEDWGKILQQLIPTDLNRIQVIKLERLSKVITRLTLSNRPVKQLLMLYVQEAELYEGIRSLSLSHDHAEEKVASIMGIMRFISNLEGNATDILNYLFTLQQNAEQQHQQAVTITTIHRAKGLEWDTVLIPGLNDKLIPYSLRTENLTKAEQESERRLLYVAMTRAKLALHLFVPKRHQHALFKPSRFEFELKIEQSLLLGGSLDRKETFCELPKGMKATTISKQYAEVMQCELQTLEPEPSDLAQKNTTKPQGKPVWFSHHVQHCVLGRGIVTGDQSGSFTVEFDDRQARVFSKETADRFFTAIED
jgi:DNA helicase-2/ATP-dependent DNA helicase PcrA